MLWSGNGLWRGVIPGQAACASVSYRVRALDAAGNAGTSQPLAYVVRGSCGIPGDLDGNGVVNALDLAALLAAWDAGGPADLDGDGTVGALDLAILLANFTT